MNLNDFVNQIEWDWNDLIKACLSLFAGFVLGFEREWKDKSAGFKTISIICLGSTLFTLLSYKLGMGESEDATRIASYVVSGIGFLGAGVIFKDGVNVNGLTTASIIWMSAAVGMAIGFGIYLTAAMFLCACLLIIFSGKFINTYIIRNIIRVISISVTLENLKYKDEVLEQLRPLVKQLRVKKQIRSSNIVTVELEVLIDKSKIHMFDSILMSSVNLIEVRI